MKADIEQLRQIVCDLERKRQLQLMNLNATVTKLNRAEKELAAAEAAQQKARN